MIGVLNIVPLEEFLDQAVMKFSSRSQAAWRLLVKCSLWPQAIVENLTVLQ